MQNAVGYYHEENMWSLDTWSRAGPPMIPSQVQTLCIVPFSVKHG